MKQYNLISVDCWNVWLMDGKAILWTDKKSRLTYCLLCILTSKHMLAHGWKWWKTPKINKNIYFQSCIREVQYPHWEVQQDSKWWKKIVKKRQMLKLPGLNSSGLHILVLWCNCLTYDDNISPKFKKPSFAILGS